MHATGRISPECLLLSDASIKVVILAEGVTDHCPRGV